jgi:hypothetical protein
MPEPTLNAQFTDLKEDVGFFLGWGRTESAWDTDQTDSVERCVKGGLRKFYYCGHDWSFLKPVVTLTLESGAETVALPEDCGGVDGKVVVSTDGSSQWCPVDFGPIGRVYQAYASQPSTTGKPLYGCQEPLKGTGPVEANRFQLRFWPIADQAYTLKFQSFINPEYLSGAQPYAYGGPQHAETLLEACLSVAEKILDDQATLHDREFKERLAVSIDIDRRQKPQVIGYNRDLSDLMESRRWTGRDHWSSPVQVNGVTY